jgi:hypothetical protein
VHDIVVTYGVGMSIGGMAPDPHGNCVRNVTFENIYFIQPMKVGVVVSLCVTNMQAIHIKTDPGDKGTANITHITYRNITGFNTMWVPLWIAPEQQHQPGKCQFVNETML